MRLARRGRKSGLISCTFDKGVATKSCKHLGQANLRLLSHLGSRLPDVEVLINKFDEPRVLLAGSRALTTGSVDAKIDSIWKDHSRENVWTLLTESCHTAAREDNTASIRKPSAHTIVGQSFVQNMSAAQNLCLHPEYKDMHGVWMSPTTFRHTSIPLPILTTSSLSAMADIPYPAPAYGDWDSIYRPNEDAKWDAKMHALYWVESTTGGYHTNTTEWRKFHRHRFMSLANRLTRQSYTYLRRHDHGGWQENVSETINESHYFASFTNLVQCENNVRQDVLQTFNITSTAHHRSKEAEYTMNFDIDGNGHSGRLYRLLASNSLPLKLAMFREWHDARLIPWLHFIPVSLSMNELPEIVRYFIEEEEGRRLAQRLAQQGQEWARRALRPIDQTVYLHRLLLELARVQNHTRLAG